MIKYLLAETIFTTIIDYMITVDLCQKKEYGRASTERPAGGGLLLGIRLENCDGKQVSGGLSGDGGGAGLMFGGEGGGVAIFGGHYVRGGGQTPADCLHRSAEVLPIGVVFFAARHSGQGTEF